MQMKQLIVKIDEALKITSKDHEKQFIKWHYTERQ